MRADLLKPTDLVFAAAMASHLARQPNRVSWRLSGGPDLSGVPERPVKRRMPPGTSRLCPAYAVPAQRHGASLLMPLPGAYAPLANVSGFPVGVVPVTRVRPDEESDRPASYD